MKSSRGCNSYSRKRSRSRVCNNVVIASALQPRAVRDIGYTASRRLSCCAAVAIGAHRTVTSGAPKNWQPKTEMALETLPWDPAEHLKTAEDVREYLEVAFEDGDPALIAATLEDVAQARGMTEIAREAGISREAMYKAFRPEGNSTLETLARVIRALGLQLAVRAA